MNNYMKKNIANAKIRKAVESAEQLQNEVKDLIPYLPDDLQECIKNMNDVIIDFAKNLKAIKQLNKYSK